MKTCPKCATSLPLEAPFCGNCGARQPNLAPPPDPRVPTQPVSGLSEARTQMGYSAQELVNHMQAQGVAAPLPGLGQAPPPAPAYPPGVPPGALQTAPGHSSGAPQNPQRNPALASAAPVFTPANAATLMIDPSAGHAPPVAPAAQGAALAATLASPASPGSAGVHPGYLPTAMPGQLPSAGQPQIAPSNAPTQFAPAPVVPSAPVVGPPPMVPITHAEREDPTGARPLAPEQFSAAVFQPTSGQPVIPAAATVAKSDSFDKVLRLVLVLFGALSLISFTTPTSTDPLAFVFDAIDGTAASQLVVLLTPALLGFFAIVISVLPLSTPIRGAIGAGLALGLALYQVTIGTFQWQQLGVLAPCLMVAGLIVRLLEPESLIARLFATIGVVLLLATLLVPVNGTIPLVAKFDAAFAASGSAMVIQLIELAGIAIAIASLLVWLPKHITPPAGLLAWLLILWPMVEAYSKLVIAGHIADVVKASPSVALTSWILASSFIAIGGYGIAAAARSRDVS